MELKILKVDGRGSASNEYIIFSVLKDCNLKSFIVCDKTFNSDGTPSNKHRHVYFFPSCEVKAGEIVWLNTCPGTNRKNETHGVNALMSSSGGSIPLYGMMVATKCISLRFQKLRRSMYLLLNRRIPSPDLLVFKISLGGIVVGK